MTMPSTPSEQLQAEEDRLRAAYARRPNDLRYSLRSAGHLFMTQQLERAVLKVLNEWRPASMEQWSILEFGCGTGFWLRQFVQWGADPFRLHGVDLLPHRIEAARHLSPEGIHFSVANAIDIDYPAASFDLVFHTTLFTSVLDADVRRRIASEMMRVLKPGGLILWYDFHVNNPRNPDVRAISAAEIRQLFPRCRVRLKKTTLLPPLVRALAPISWLLCEALGAVPPLCTHYLGAISAPQ